MKQFYTIAFPLSVWLFISGCATSSGKYIIPKEQFYQQVKKVAVLPAENNAVQFSESSMQEILVLTDKKITDKLLTNKIFDVIPSDSCRNMMTKLRSEMQISGFKNPISGEIDTLLKKEYVNKYKDKISAEYLIYSYYISKNENMDNSRVIWDGVSQKIYSDTRGYYKGTATVVSLVIEIQDKNNNLLWKGIGGVGMLNDGGPTVGRFLNVSPEAVFRLNDKSLDRIDRAVKICLESIIPMEE